MFALVDANSFYCSCETAWRPDLDNSPVVTASNNDGCVIARNARAKKLGIKMGDPLFKNEELFRRHGVVVFSSNYELYGDMSHRMMTTLETICPRVSVYSIDEAFCDLTGVRNCRDLTEFGHEIKRIVYQRTLQAACPDGEIGRHPGLKIPCRESGVPVRSRLGAPQPNTY